MDSHYWESLFPDFPCILVSGASSAGQPQGQQGPMAHQYSSETDQKLIPEINGRIMSTRPFHALISAMFGSENAPNNGRSCGLNNLKTLEIS